MSDTDSDEEKGREVVRAKRPRRGGLAHEAYFVRKQIDHDTKQNIVSDYKNKMTIKYITDNYGISRRTIYKYVNAADKAHAIHQTKGRPKIIDDEGCAKICEYYNNCSIKDVMSEGMMDVALAEANRTAEACRLMNNGSNELAKIDKVSYTTLSRILSKGGCFNKKSEGMHGTAM